MVNIMSKLIIILILIFFSFCAREHVSNFSVNQMEAVTLDGKSIKLSSLKADRLALNIYSPTCVPCVKELPVLGLLYDEFKAKGSVKLFIAIDPETNASI